MITKYERLVAVTPAKNEERFIRRCVDSVLNQTYPVTLHLIVDDHSEDETVKIVKSIGNSKVKIIPSGLGKAKKQHGLRPHLVQQIGINEITRLVPDWKYLLLLDGDCWIPNYYCERLIAEMRRNSKLAMAGAKFLLTPKGIEVSSSIHVRSSNHIIRRQFYNECIRNKIDYGTPRGEILLERYAWIHGWKIHTFPIKAYEGRETGVTIDDPIIKGQNDFRLGVPLIVLLAALRKPSKDRLLQTLGWMIAKIRKEPRYFDSEQIRILQKRHLSFLIEQTYKRIKEAGFFAK